MSKALTLQEAHRLIVELSQPTPTETIALDHALGRITAEPLKAALPVPAFDHSTRDGYAVRSGDLQLADNPFPITLWVAGEIPAGCTKLPGFASGQALRIMTGAAIPPDSDLVLPQEDVTIRGDTIIVRRPAAAGAFIRKKGHDLARGRTIVRPGETLAPDHLALLATAGINDIRVHQKPSVAVICTGSELAPQGEVPMTGQVISGNRLLLDGLIKNCGSTTAALVTAADQKEEIAAKLRSVLSDQVPLIITTGGMGPGKFDLMEEVFTEIGVEIIYNSLKVNPGRATMLGIFAGSMLFALPGPPPAVRLLFNELIKPALRKMGGARMGLRKTLRAELSGSLELRSGNYLNLKGGLYFIEGGKLRVNLAPRSEKLNCVIFLPPGRRVFKSGEKVTIHPTTQEF